MSTHKCPYCEGELKRIPYTDWGQKIWDGKEWKEDKEYGEMEFRCPHCGTSIEYPILEEMGVL